MGGKKKYINIFGSFTVWYGILEVLSRSPSIEGSAFLQTNY